MAAWNHSKNQGWNLDVYYGYRKFVLSNAPGYRGRDEDCADLSMTLLVDYAAANGLMVTFQDYKGRIYMSKAAGVITGHAGRHELDDDTTWSSKDEYLKVVRARTRVADLWYYNTTENDLGPSAGDLMMIYKAPNQGDRHHAALVYKTYGPGTPHVKEKDTGVPDFPGPDTAMKQSNQTEYFKGTVDDDGATLTRAPDYDVHLDYLNSRGDAKRNAELVYFANARQVSAEGFKFMKYSPAVTDNWFDWNGDGLPPFATHHWPGRL